MTQKQLIQALKERPEWIHSKNLTGQVIRIDNVSCTQNDSSLYRVL